MQRHRDLIDVGEVIAGKYSVTRVLGMGNMGVVAAAKHIGLDQEVAIKLLLSAASETTDEQRARFVREARAAVKLKSQHVARVLDVGTTDRGAPYLAMELLDGRDLGAEIKARGPLPIEDAIEYVLQASEALGEAHAAGIVHRDIKPPNLFLTRDASGAPCIKVLDFGVSKNQSAELALTAPTQLLGSPLYMSPEALKASNEVDARTDVWSLGVTLYELLSCSTPFRAQSFGEVVTKVHFYPPESLAQHRADLPSGLEAVILHALEKDRDRRFQSVAELAAALAPYAPARALPYVERAAIIAGSEVKPARPTTEFPAVRPTLLDTSAKSLTIAEAASVAPIPGSVSASNAAVTLNPPSAMSAEPTNKRGLILLGAVTAVSLAAVLAVFVITRSREAPSSASSIGSASGAASGVSVNASPNPSASAVEVAPSMSAAHAAPSPSASVGAVPRAPAAPQATGRIGTAATALPKPVSPAPAPLPPTPAPQPQPNKPSDGLYDQRR